jgi:hypothetical protein
VLCNSWSAGPPYIYVFFIPQPLPDQSRPKTPAYGVPLNRTTVTAIDIDNIHTKQTYKQIGEYTGYYHPFDGIIAQSGLAVPLAYVMTAMAKLPSWAPMVIISLLTRTFMYVGIPLKFLLSTAHYSAGAEEWARPRQRVPQLRVRDSDRRSRRTLLGVPVVATTA